MEFLWLLIPGAIVVFLGIVLVRALLFRPAPEAPATPEPVTVDRDKVVKDMVAMIRCKTVSYRDSTLVDWAEFEKFQALLVERFPLVHQHCTLEKSPLGPGKTGLLYHLPGRHS
ncbi:MAG: peptidase M20, partial [Clostridia bacterium]|nr:peptidase M20 [Clostridia bacterium]